MPVIERDVHSTLVSVRNRTNALDRYLRLIASPSYSWFTPAHSMDDGPAINIQFMIKDSEKRDETI